LRNQIAATRVLARGSANVELLEGELDDASVKRRLKKHDGADVVFAAILGTGVGAGIAVHGRPLSGANGIAGEWGHVPLPAPRDDERPGPPSGHGLRPPARLALPGQRQATC
jgi:hypothetical protein